MLYEADGPPVGILGKNQSRSIGSSLKARRIVREVKISKRWMPPLKDGGYTKRDQERSGDEPQSCRMAENCADEKPNQYQRGKVPIAKSGRLRQKLPPG